MRKTGSLLNKAGWLAVALTVALSAGCGGGGGAAEEETGGGTGEASYTFSSASQNLVLHFDAPVTAEAPSASASKSIDPSLIAITEKLTNAPLEVGGVWLSGDQMVAVVGAPFKSLTEYSVNIEGLYYVDGPEVPAISLDLTTPANPESLEDGAYADMLAADSEGSIIIAPGPNLMPGPDDPTDLLLSEIASDTISMEGEVLGYPGYQRHYWAKLGDGHSFLMSRWNGPSPLKVEADTYQSYLLFDDKGADPVAEFVPSGLDDSDTSSTIHLAARAGDHNGDGLPDILFGERVKVVATGAMTFYFRIFFGREGGFAEQIAMDEADVTIPLDVYFDPSDPTESFASFEAMVRIYDYVLRVFVVPPHAVGDFDGDGRSDLAHINYSPYLRKTVVHVYLGSADTGVERGMPDLMLTAPGEFKPADTLYPEVIMGLAAGNVNGDFSLVDGEPVAVDDLIVGTSMAYNVTGALRAEIPASSFPAGKVSVLFGRPDWPLYEDGGSVSTSTADIAITDEDDAQLFATGLQEVIMSRDLDGDLKAEIVVGSPKAAGGEGKAFLFHGATLAAGGQFTTGNASLFTGTAGYVGFGAGTEALGDLDNDGLIDIMVGGYGVGGSPILGYVYSGVDLDAILITTGKALDTPSAVSVITLDPSLEVVSP